VIFPMLTKLWDVDQPAFCRLAAQTCKSLWAAALPLMALVLLESDRFLPLIYGEKFTNAVLAQQILTPCLATAFLHNLAAYVMIGMHKHKLFFCFYASGMVVNLLCCVVIIPRFPLEGAALTLTITKVWVALLTVSYFQRHAKPLTLLEWLLMILVCLISFGLWVGLSSVVQRELMETVVILPMLVLFWFWRPPAPFTQK
ncbi:MAG: polysaccharide biosynthesis C-terminal domain-containing protein, partial [Desulfovibrio sp.]|nr:polysaccharide biosynthesis C-terminal domain-containing protein [Desulfovibrio sp.]